MSKKTFPKIHTEVFMFTEDCVAEAGKVIDVDLSNPENPILYIFPVKSLLSPKGPGKVSVSGKIIKTYCFGLWSKVVIKITTYEGFFTKNPKAILFKMKK